MIENREERGDEDDGGQHLEREDGAGRGRDDLAESAGVGKAEFAEEDARSREGGRKHPGDDIARPRHGALAEVEAQDEEGEGDLQAEAPGDGAPANVAAVRWNRARQRRAQREFRAVR